MLTVEQVKGMNQTEALAAVIVEAIRVALAPVIGALEAHAVRLDTIEASLQESLKKYMAVWDGSQQYTYGHLVTFDGSMWHCNCSTRARPGTSKDWTLCVRRGKDGKDLRDQR